MSGDLESEAAAAVEREARERTCGAFHPEYGFTCGRPRHDGPHFDLSGGFWDETGQVTVRPIRGGR